MARSPRSHQPSMLAGRTALGKRSAPPTDADTTRAAARRKVVGSSAAPGPKASTSFAGGMSGQAGNITMLQGGPSAAASSRAPEANIQVAVRVRGRSAPNAPRPSDSCILTDGPRSNKITISSDPLAESSLGIQTASLLPFASPIKKSVSKGKLNTATDGADTRVGTSNGLAMTKKTADGNSAGKKTYTFDHVFGPEADQGMVYSDLVAPILDEVLDGYNCTIFAYGQTGTGKTHTMEGDLTPHPSATTFATEAGIIPRTLFRLFHILDSSGAEYSVRASLVELYNEELRDLLADEESEDGGQGNAPSKAGAKSGAAGTSKAKETSGAASAYGAIGANGGMRMYDDAKGRGVMIQGLEEIPITSAEAGLELLRRGSAKRHTAATNCNSQSSRSHSVLTLTICHTTTNNVSSSPTAPSSSGADAIDARQKDGKQAGASGSGEDVMRIGKLNLVDLAGSENIGRSGAADKRAREAGMINQSLLTLGRVINALVEKQSHIPFRESKLTRLLQDSLGGRTKTCIIATVSESKDSIDETLSTLEYATRARSIQNRPEINARTTRTAFLNEYISENLRLRQDLKATRLKNGVYLAPDRLETMEQNHANAVREAQALKLQLDLTNSKVDTMREQLEQNSAVLGRKEEEARMAKAELAQSRAECTRLKEELEVARRKEHEEAELRQAFMLSEGRVNGVAEGLLSVLTASNDEVARLHDKLGRLSSIDNHNRELMSKCRSAVRELVGKVQIDVGIFKDAHGRTMDSLTNSLMAFADQQGSTASEHLKNVEEGFVALQDALADVRGGSSGLTERSQALKAHITYLSESITSEAERRAQRLADICQSFFDNVRARQQQFDSITSTQVQELSDRSQALQEALDNFFANSKVHIRNVQSVASQAIQAEREQLAAERKRLEASVRAERARAQANNATFLDAIQKATSSLVDAHTRGFNTFVADLEPAMTQRAARVQDFEQQHNQGVAALQTSLHEVSKTSNQDLAAHAATLQGLDTELSSWKEELADRLQSLEGGELASYQRRCATDAETERQRLEQLATIVVEEGEQGKAVIDEAAAAAEAVMTNLESTTRSGHVASAEAIQNMAKNLQADIEVHRNVGMTFSNDCGKHLGKVRTRMSDYLGERVRQDARTNATPQRHGWTFPSQWPTLPSNRAAALRHVAEHGVGEPSFGFDYKAGPPQAAAAHAQDGSEHDEALPSSVQSPTLRGVTDTPRARRRATLITPASPTLTSKWLQGEDDEDEDVGDRDGAGDSPMKEIGNSVAGPSNAATTTTTTTATSARTARPSATPAKATPAQLPRATRRGGAQAGARDSHQLRTRSGR